jgi:hypothetical protein
MQNAFIAFFDRLGQHLFGERTLLPLVPSIPVEEEIPRYPPFMKGLPTAPVDRILSTQTELIKAIEQALALPDDLYQTIVMPVIERYAAFSHLLPASESHHHRGAGGLFRHGLEVAHWASMAAQGCLFAAHATPRERKEQELRWRLAVCFAGLLHDIGKPVSDMAVVDRQGKSIWNPCDENLTDWAAQNNIDRYFLRWRENRHKRHEQFSALVIERVLTRESRTYILTPGPDIMQAMLETIHGLDRGAKLYELVMTADRKSVERDLKTHYHTVDSAMGMPVEKYLFDAMRRLIKSGKWIANEKGARVWRFKEGVHIVWRTGAQDIVDTLAKDKVPGIPRDEDTLADILIERGLAIPKILPDGRHYRYWRMQPQDLDVTLYMLRLTSAELIFSNEPPIAIEGIEVELEPEPTVISDSKPLVTKQALQPKPTVQFKPTLPLSVNADNNLVTPKNKECLEQTESPISAQESATPLNPIAAQQSENQSSDFKTTDTQKIQAQTTQLSNDKAELPPKAAKPTDHVTKLKKTKQLSNPAKTETLISHANVESSKPNEVETARQWLQNQGLAGEWLLQIATEINEGRWEWNNALQPTNGKCLLPFPETTQKLNIDPNLFIKTLEEKGWLFTDVLSPMRKVQVINQVRGIVLTPEPSGFFKQLITPVTQSSQPFTLPTEQSPNNSIPAPQIAAEDKLPKPLLDKNPTLVKTDEQIHIPETVQLPLADIEASQSKPKNRVNSKQTDKSKTKQESVSEPVLPQIVTELNSTEDKTQTVSHPIKESFSTNPVDQQAVEALIAHLRKTISIAGMVIADQGWSAVEPTDIAQFLKLHPNIKRNTLMREMTQHPDCLIKDRSIKIRFKP